MKAITTESKNEKTISLMQLVIAALICSGTAVGAWVNINSRLAVNETETANVKEEVKQLREDVKHIRKTADAILFRLK